MKIKIQDLSADRKVTPGEIYKIMGGSMPLEPFPLDPAEPESSPDMFSLRLQMTMDRRSKFISTMSQMMKKISTTQDLLIQNIK
jgi:hypothetical protein